MDFEARLRRASMANKQRATAALLARREPMPQINSAGVSLVKAILRALARPRYVLMALALAAVTTVVIMSMQSCRSSVPIVIQNEQYQCQIEIRNEKGTTNFKDCIRSDGHEVDIEAPGGAGDDSLDLNTDPTGPVLLDDSEQSKSQGSWIPPVAFGAGPPPPHIVRSN